MQRGFIPKYGHLFIGVLLALQGGRLSSQTLETDIWLIEALPYKGIDILVNEPTHSARNITGFNPYENQPHFLPDGKTLLYTAIGRDGQADVFSVGLPEPFTSDLNLADRSTFGPTRQLTSTLESEYSPMITPDGKHFSVVRVEQDSSQRLWQFDLDGRNPQVLFPEQKQIGYYAWAGQDDVLCFLLPEPFTLVRLRKGLPTETIADSVGRCIQRIPGTRMMSYVVKTDKGNDLYAYDLATGTSRWLIRLMEGTEDYVWTSGSHEVLACKGSGLFVFNLGNEWATSPDAKVYDGTWKLWHDFAAHGLTDMYRIALSPNGQHIAVVNRLGTR